MNIGLKQIFRAGFAMMILTATAACDNIYGSLPDPYVHPVAQSQPEEPKTGTSKLPYGRATLKKNDMQEICNFILTTRQIILDMVNKMEAAKDKNKDDFIGQRYWFQEQQRTYDMMVSSRLDKFFSDRIYSPDHPGYVLNQALDLFHQELQNYSRYFFQMDPLDPQIDRDLMKTLAKVKPMIAHYSDATPAPPLKVNQ